MSRFRMSLLGEDGATDLPVDGPLEPASETLESDLLEVNESSDEGAAIEDAVEEGAEIHDALGELQEDLQVAQENGGLDRVGARIAARHLQMLLKRAGKSNPDRVFPALESFGTTGTRQNSTRLAMESVGSTMKELWNKIVRMIQKAYDWCFKHIQNLAGATKKLKERAEKLSKRAGAVDTGGQFDAKAIDNESLSRRLTLNGAISPTAGISVLREAAAAYVSKWETTSQATSTALLNALKAITSAASGGDTSKLASEFEVAGGKVGEALVGIAGISTTKEEKAEGVLKLVSALPGGKSLVVVVPDGDTKVLTKNDAKKLKVTVEDTKAFKPVKSFAPLKAEEAVKLADEVASLAESMEDFAKVQPALKRIESAVAKAGDDLSKLSTNDSAGKSNADAKATVQAAGTLVVNVAPAFGTFPVKVLGLAIAGGKAHLDWVEASLSRYSKAASEE
jgi:hypothetical protein